MFTQEVERKIIGGVDILLLILIQRKAGFMVTSRKYPLLLVFLAFLVFLVIFRHGVFRSILNRRNLRLDNFLLLLSNRLIFPIT